MRLKPVVLLVLLPLSLYAVDPNDAQQIQQRIQPVGKVHVQGQSEIQPDNGGANTVATPVKVKKDPGQMIYEQHCIICHRDGLAGAPKFQNEADWKSRLEGKKIEDLVVSSIKGKNAMPAKGTCIECSDDDLKAAIQYMLPKS